MNFMQEWRKINKHHQDLLFKYGGIPTQNIKTHKEIGLLPVMHYEHNHYASHTSHNWELGGEKIKRNFPFQAIKWQESCSQTATG